MGKSLPLHIHLESRLDIRAGLMISYQLKHSVHLCQFRELLFYPPQPPLHSQQLPLTELDLGNVKV